VTRSTSTRVQASRDAILAVIRTIKMVCDILLTLIPLLEGILKTLEDADKAIAGRKGK